GAINGTKAMILPGGWSMSVRGRPRFVVVPLLVAALIAVSVATIVRAGRARTSAKAGTSTFVTFESGQVRPLAMSLDGAHLHAANPPDNRLEVFDVDAHGLTKTASIPVGLEPVAVAARTAAEVWVVNHLSDSVSIVDTGSSPPRVVRT